MIIQKNIYELLISFFNRYLKCVHEYFINDQKQFGLLQNLQVIYSDNIDILGNDMFLKSKYYMNKLCFLHFLSTVIDLEHLDVNKFKYNFLKSVTIKINKVVNSLKEEFLSKDFNKIMDHDDKQIKGEIGAFMKSEKIETFEQFHEYFCMMVKTQLLLVKQLEEKLFSLPH